LDFTSSYVLDIQSFGEVDLDTDHYLVVAKVKEKLAVSKQKYTYFIRRCSISRNKMRKRVKNRIR
jgi:hypothetical protein